MHTRQSNALRAPQESLRDAEALSSDIGPDGEPFDDLRDDGAPHSRYAGRFGPAPAQSSSAMRHTTHAPTHRQFAQADDDALMEAQADAQTRAPDDRRAEPHEPLGPDDPLAPLPFNPYKGNRGVTRAWHAMKNSLAGFRVAIREESAFRQELTLAAILVPCGIVVPVEPVSRVLLLGSVFLVLIVELLNSSVEAAIDRISLERHELSRRAKDLGSAAVMVALFMCVMTWVLIVGPLVVHWVGGLIASMR
ncbi:diacylglycerol kinase [Paraburkholderia sp. LEh10]|jgi:diacylglycerol kinase (ATP)|uniref:diacylglycerol kinase n=1 Tax=Paraburkholderia sp. LEh10 TaxID=2821353 RepID=UPI001AE8A683|nr:diacylglycerol kinase [Paraburkholderia sp. LEh10]MBP0595211.1 diacylglycerol kinase [Paraburkholderia sp. LEh10]